MLGSKFVSKLGSFNLPHPDVDAGVCLVTVRSDVVNEDRPQQTIDWTASQLGVVESDDGSLVQDRTWKLHLRQLIYSSDSRVIGELANCSSTGVMALIDMSFFDDVDVQYEFMVENAPTVGVAVGFVFRIASLDDFYRFEWNDQGCMSIVHYTTVAKKRTASVLGTVHADLIRGLWYSVELLVIRAVIDVRVKSVNQTGSVTTPLNTTYSLSVTDPGYRASLRFGAGFYASGDVRLYVDDVTIVAHADRRQLGSWHDETWPTPCVTLSDQYCFFEDFEEKYLDDIAHEIVADGRSQLQANMRSLFRAFPLFI
jgi:hypothetical protein